MTVIYELEAPDGSILEIEGPEGASEAELQQFAEQAYSQQPAQQAGDSPTWVLDAESVPRFGQPGQDVAVPEQAGMLENIYRNYIKPLPEVAGAMIAAPAAAVGGSLVDAFNVFNTGVNMVGYGGLEAVKQLASGSIPTDEQILAAAMPYSLEQQIARNGPQTVSQKAAQYFAPTTPEGRALTQEAASILQYVTEPFGPMGAMPEAVGMAAAKASIPRVAPVASRAVTMADKAAPLLQDAQQAGVRVMTSDIVKPESFFSKAAQTIGERIPFAGTGGLRKQQQQQRIGAVRDLLDEYGASAESAASEAVMLDVLKKRGDDLAKYTNMKRDVLENSTGSGVVPVPKTIAKIDEEITKLKSLNLPKVDSVIKELDDWKAALSGQELTNIEVLRKQIGENFKAPELAAVRSTGEKALSSIYGVLRDEMGDFIKSTNGSSDFVKWKVANKKLADMAGELKTGTLKSTLNRGDMDASAVERMLFNQKPGEIKQLFRALTTEGRQNAKIAILSKAAKDAAEDVAGIERINPDKFIRNLQKTSKSVGIFFDANELSRVNGLVKVLGATRRAADASLHLPTGMQNYYNNFLGLLGVGGAGAVASGGSAGIIPAIGAAGTIGVAARVYESAPIRNILLRLSKVEQGTSEFQRLSAQLNDEILRQSATAQRVALIASRTEQARTEQERE
jgi:hypothetical protein